MLRCGADWPVNDEEKTHFSFQHRKTCGTETKKRSIDGVGEGGMGFDVANEFVCDVDSRVPTAQGDPL